VTAGARRFPNVARFRRGPGPRNRLGLVGPVQFTRSPRSQYAFTISGVTRDSGGSPLGGCIVKLFETSAADTKIGETMSDGAGAFVLSPPTNSGTYWIAAFDVDGNPAGVTVNTLVAG